MASRNLYLMRVEHQNRWLPMHAAGIVYDNGWVSVEIGGRVIEAGGDGAERDITDEERQCIGDIADGWSASK